MANQVAYGFADLESVMSQRVTEVGVDIVTTAIDATVAEHNRQLSALLGLFIERTEAFKTRFTTPTLTRNQPLDEKGRARPVVTYGSYDIAFPLYYSGQAIGDTYLASLEMTVAEANARALSLISGDMRWMRDHILAALYANASWTYTDPLHGALTILGLANADSQKYLITSGSDAGATDSHYLGQAAAIDDSNNPFSTIYSELMEHPENGGDVIVFVPSNLKAAVVALTAFNPLRDANIQRGSGSDVLTGTLGVAVPGELFGYDDSKCWLAEWRSLPDNYMIAVTTQGARPLKMREHPTLKGFTKVAEQNDHPWYKTQYMRAAGFGGNNRVGALCYRIGNATYDAPPTGYAEPLA